MVLAVWTPKGGSGCTVTSCALAIAAARDYPFPALLVDTEGDVPAALGVLDSPGLGVGDWIAAGQLQTASTLLSHAIATTAGLSVLPAGTKSRFDSSDHGTALARVLATHGGAVVVDLGASDSKWQREVMDAADSVVMVIRACYLGLRRARRSPNLDLTAGVVVIEETGRRIGSTEIEDVLGLPIWGSIPWRAAIASAVDAGVLAQRLPEELLRGSRRIWASAPLESRQHVA